MMTDMLYAVLVGHKEDHYGCTCGWLKDEEDPDPDFPNLFLNHVRKVIRTRLIVLQDFGEDSLLDEMSRHKSSPQGLCSCGYDHRTENPKATVWETLSKHLAVESAKFVIKLGDTEEK